MTQSTQLEELRAVLRNQGLAGGLAYLNKRVLHRFTAVYQLESGTLRNVAIVDKLGEIVPDNLLAVPIESSFCQFVLRDGFFKRAGNSDPRLAGHPYEEAVQSYVGVPLSREGGDLFGTFCHFDFPALPLSDDEFAFMGQVAKELPRHLGRPGQRSGEGSASLIPHLHQQVAAQGHTALPPKKVH